MSNHLRIAFEQRLVLAGMVGLALLTGTHQLRGTSWEPGPLAGYLLGVMPNFAAALAMPLVLAGLIPRIARAEQKADAHRDFTRLLAFTTAGLVGWEFFQRGSRNLFFDLHDLLATGVGAASAFLAFVVLLARREATPGPR